MKNKNEAIKIIELLKKAYPDATCSLDFETPFQMMIAVMLSAQCTDERVNKTTPELFKKYPTAEAMSKADIKDIEEIIITEETIDDGRNYTVRPKIKAKTKRR